MKVIEIPDEQAANWSAKAARHGLTLQSWIQQMADADKGDEATSPELCPLQTVADIVLEEMRKVPADIMANMPTDGASQHDHYLYGWPKKEA